MTRTQLKPFAGSGHALDGSTFGTTYGPEPKRLGSICKIEPASKLGLTQSPHPFIPTHWPPLLYPGKIPLFLKDQRYRHFHSKQLLKIVVHTVYRKTISGSSFVFT